MRVLAGRYNSKLIRTINDPLTRPMMSKVRESIFNSLQFNIENKDILDLYAGSGSLGIESLSRGANFVTFIENSDNFKVAAIAVAAIKCPQHIME